MQKLSVEQVRHLASYALTADYLAKLSGKARETLKLTTLPPRGNFPGAVYHQPRIIELPPRGAFEGTLFHKIG